MMMSAFISKFPELAQKETRSITIPDDSYGLQAGQYSFVEFFCTEDHCDCRRAMIQVLGPGNKVLATLNYGWENLKFYTTWMYGDDQTARDLVGVQFYIACPQTKYSDQLLEFFKAMLKDEAYANRIKSHYKMFKGTQVKQVDGARLVKKMRSPFASKFF